MKKSIKKNYIYNLLYQVLAIIIPIITIPYVSRVLGARNIGIYGYTLSISAYFILFGSLGVALYGQREIAYVQNDKKKYSKKFWEIFLLKLLTMTIATIIFYFAFVKFSNNYNIYFKILLLELIGTALDISWFFQGLEEFGKTVSRNLIVKIASLICIFLFVKTKNDLYIYFIIYALSIILGNLSLWLYIPKYVNKVSLKSLNILGHLRPAIMLFIPQAAIQIYTVLDRTMIGVIILDKSEVGFYTQGERIIKLLLTIVGAMGIVMLPRIANRFAKNDTKSIKAYLNKSFNLTLLLSFPLIFGLILVSDSFVPIFFGDGFDKVSIIMKVISPIILFIGISGIIGYQYFLPTQHQKEYTISVILGAVINFIINILLIPRYGAIGAAIGTVAAEFMVAGYQIIKARHFFDYKLIIKDNIKYLIASIIMFIICYCTNKLFNLVGLKQVIIDICLGGITYFIILLVTKDKLLFEILNKIINFGGKNEKSIKGNS